MSSDFLEQGSHFAEWICASRHTESRKFKMAADKPELSHISGDSCDKIKIPTDIPMFSMMRNLYTAIRTLSDVSRSQKSNMAAAKPEILPIAAGRQDGIEITKVSDFMNMLEQIVLLNQPKLLMRQ